MLYALSASCISTAAATARYVWSDSAMGAPQTAMISSPMNLSSVPSWRNTMSTMISKYSLSIETMVCGSSRSLIAVKPRMSENSTVASRS